MSAACPSCIAGPAAIDGHAELSVRTIGSTVLTFGCRRCDTQWARTVSRGVFLWTPIGATGRPRSSGLTVPPRSTPFEMPTPVGTT
jgi:hypothetical protein